MPGVWCTHCHHGERTVVDEGACVRHLLTVLALAGAAVLTGCGGDEPEDRPAAVATADNGDVYNEVDVELATELIPHHAEALVLVDLTRGRDLHPDLRKLRQELLASRGAEIETMTQWLTAWDKPVPETARDHANAGHGDDQGDDHDHGAAGGDDLEQLEELEGEDFQRTWLELLREHQEEGAELAEEAADGGRFRPAVQLARKSAAAQREDVERIDALLDELGS